MLKAEQRIAIYAEATMGLLNAKFAEGVIRYGNNPITSVIDSKVAGKQVKDVCNLDSEIPIVATMDEAIRLGADVLVLGTAPSGGRVPSAWLPVLQSAVDAGLCIVNGLHDPLNEMFDGQLKQGQWIWDIRIPNGEMPLIATARASELNNTRVLMVGTDMAVGKMTAGLEIYKTLIEQGHDAAFLASGQIGISLTGKGIPLDAFKVDHASGAVERMVMESADHDILLIEGQGSLLHPGSTATLPLMRGSCCNAMILCHRSGMKTLDTLDHVKVPPLSKVIELNEMTASANGTLTRAKVVGIAVNTSQLDDQQAQQEIENLRAETGLPVTDPVRYGATELASAILAV